MRASFCRGLCASVAGLLFAANAAAQDTATAGALFDKGVADMEAKRFASACPAIEESQRLDPRPGTLFTLAECLAGWGKVASAVSRYQEYVDLVPLLTPQQQARHRERVATARAQLTKLKPTVPTLTLVLSPNAPAGTTVLRNGETLGSAALGLALPVDPGPYEIVTRAPGVPDRPTSVTLALGDAKRLELEAGTPAATPSPPPAPLPPPAAVPVERQVPAAPPAEPSSGSGRRTAAYVAGGVGVAGVALGTVTGILVLGKKQTVNDNCPNHDCNDAGYSAVESGKDLALVSTVGFGVGIAGLVVGGVLLLTGSDGKPAPSARSWQPVLTAGGGTYGGGLTGRF